MSGYRTKLFLGFLLSGAFISAVGYGFDRLLLTEGVPRFDVLLLSNVLTGVVCGALFLQFKFRSMEKQKLLEDRLQKIADMNHHVRNALQVVSYYGYLSKDSEAAKLIDESIRRIEWTLREVLPRGWGLDGVSTQKREEHPPRMSA